MKTIDLILVGLGNVGKGFLTLLANEADRILADFELKFRVVGLADLQTGNFINPDGFDPAGLLEMLDQGDLRAIEPLRSNLPTDQLISSLPAHFLVEASYTNFETAEPAFSYMKAALTTGKHVVTSNKGPIALYYQELAGLAKVNKVRLGVEGTVMSGTPTMRMGTEILRGAKIEKIQGILNGTTNYILSKMAEGQDYQSALRDAQNLGYAEADPTGDVEGFDAAGKVVILANLVMGTPIKLEQVERTGITGLKISDIQAAKQNHSTWKLLGTIEKTTLGSKATVTPVMLPNSHPLAGVNGATNAVTFSTKLMGEITLIGAGAGRIETGFALLNDILTIESSTP